MVDNFAVDEEIRFQNITFDHALQFAELYLPIWSDTSPWSVDNFLRELPEKWRLSFGVWMSSQPIGICIMSRRRGFPHIHHFMVQRRWRNTGIGSRMLAHAKNTAGNQISLKVSPENIGAIRFYTRHGFQNVSLENEHWVMISAVA